MNHPTETMRENGLSCRGFELLGVNRRMDMPTKNHFLGIVCLISIITVYALFRFPTIVCADSEAGNSPYVRASEDGGVYAKCIPNEISGDRGKTFVYKMGKKGEELLCSFNWYPGDIYLVDNFRYYGDYYSVVRIGHWPRGNEPNNEELAIAFYKDCKETKRYSTADIVRLGYKDSKNVPRSKSHYTVFKKVIGFKFLEYGKYDFDVLTEEGRVLSFDPSTGEMREKR